MRVFLPLFIIVIITLNCKTNVRISDDRERLLDLSSSSRMVFNINYPGSIPSNLSLVIEYELKIPSSLEIKENFRIVLSMGASSWDLPVDMSFLGIKNQGIIRYSIPMEKSFTGNFRITFEGEMPDGYELASFFLLKSFELSERKFGFFYDENKSILFASPFVYRNENSDYIIDVPDSFFEKQFVEIEAEISGNAVIKIADRIIEALPGLEKIYIPPGFISDFSGKAILSGDKVSSLILKSSSLPVFPKPIKADPALVITWPRENWRDVRYEIFYWDRFPSLLMFDFADYAMQDKMLKRLAFFVEKAGFKGRLSHDEEIKDLHGWNAHDYRAEDLAVFFDTARKTNFPLLDEEWELEKILLDNGIIRKNNGSITAGYGGILSISRAAVDFMRYRFMAHEGFHLLFFIDEDSRNFSRRRWEQFPPQAKEFIMLYFEIQNYDLDNEFLMVKEFKSHILQQPLSQTANYYGRTLAWRVGTNPHPSVVSIFVEEAKVFSDYVNKRWGFAAGQAWGLLVK